MNLYNAKMVNFLPYQIYPDKYSRIKTQESAVAIPRKLRQRVFVINKEGRTEFKDTAPLLTFQKQSTVYKAFLVKKRKQQKLLFMQKSQIKKQEDCCLRSSPPHPSSPHPEGVKGGGVRNGGVRGGGSVTKKTKLTGGVVKLNWMPNNLTFSCASNPFFSLPKSPLLKSKEYINKELVATEYSLETFHRSNQDTCLLHNPVVFEGDWVQSGDLLADCAASSGGELSLGKNILVAYMPWEGFNFEDAILISERLVYEDVYSSIHIERYDIEIKDTKFGMETITRKIPELNENDLEHLDANGVSKLGSWIEEGDVLVGRITPINKKVQSTYKNLLYTILQAKPESVRDSSLRAPKGMKAKVINVQIYMLETTPSFIQPNASLQSNLLANRKTIIKTEKKIKVKTLEFKTKESQSLKKQQKREPIIMKSLPLKKKKMVCFEAFLGVKSKLKSKLKGHSSLSKQNSFLPLKEKMRCFKNKGLAQINIVYVYLAEKRKIQVGDKMAGRHGNKGIVSQVLPRQDMPFLANGTPIDMVLNPLGVPSRMNVGQIYECLLGLAAKYLGEHYKIFPFDEIYGAEASRSFVYSKLYEARKKTGSEWLFNPNCPGKTRLFDGRTGDPFDQSVTVGYAYMLKLVHLVDDKIHMRSTGPYSLVTQQPLRGRSKQGGQRLGEMEVWALEGYGAAFTLLEMLTIKSDDMTGRMTLWSNLILNKDISIGTPESFKVLVCELQALCLDIGIFRVDSVGNLNEIESLTELP